MRIKYLLLIVTLLATSINSNYLIGQDRIGIPGPLNFDGMNYFFYRSIKINNATYVQEYLPIKETSDSFHSMIICKLLITDWEVKEVAENKMKQMEDIKKTDSICNSRLFQSPDRTEYIVDYFLGEYKNKNILSGVEYYIYRYKRIKIRNDNDAVLAFVYILLDLFIGNFNNLLIIVWVVDTDKIINIQITEIFLIGEDMRRFSSD